MTSAISSVTSIANAKAVVNKASNRASLPRVSRAIPRVRAQAFHATPYDGFTFEPIREAEISRAMTSRYFKDLDQHAETDVLIVGGGSAGLAAAYELSKHPDVQVTLIEQNVAPGGGAWLGGQLFSAMCIRKPAHKFLDELEIPYEDEGAFVVVRHAALVTSTLLSKVLAAPNVKLFNATAVEDLIVKPDDTVPGGKRVAGAVTNWTLVALNHSTQSCMDPNVIESKVMISSTGHDGPMGASGVKRLARLGMIDSVKGMGALNMNEAEGSIVENTKMVAPGIIMAGMEVSEWSGSNRMGPTFGAMFISGFVAAHLALNDLEAQKHGNTNAGEAREMAQV